MEVPLKPLKAELFSVKVSSRRLKPASQYAGGYLEVLGVLFPPSIMKIGASSPQTMTQSPSKYVKLYLITIFRLVSKGLRIQALSESETTP